MHATLPLLSETDFPPLPRAMSMIAISTRCSGYHWLAWSNGANDNFKGVATLYGSRALDYHKALIRASLATVAGTSESHHGSAR